MLGFLKKLVKQLQLNLINLAGIKVRVLFVLMQLVMIIFKMLQQKIVKNIHLNVDLMVLDVFKL